MSYAGLQATAARLIAAKGFAATIRSAGTASDPVTGLGAVAGTDRTVDAVKVAVDVRAFPETLTARATCMLICDGQVSASDKWVDGSDVRPVIAVMAVEPDNASHIITKALIGG